MIEKTPSFVKSFSSLERNWISSRVRMGCVWRLFLLQAHIQASQQEGQMSSRSQDLEGRILNYRILLAQEAKGERREILSNGQKWKGFPEGNPNPKWSFKQFRALLHTIEAGSFYFLICLIILKCSLLREDFLAELHQQKIKLAEFKQVSILVSTCSVLITDLTRAHTHKKKSQ